ncbi:MAG: imidazole glycerol phosphate synthase subunit HisF [Bacteroidetes bacterium]|nr:MAG: imidazole glycerol phosphate synthase subunit HisF [Bacteroidota bacterium]
MLKKRIIPCLDIKSGRTVKGVNFNDLTDAGDPVELAQRYALEGADELVFLDITATNEKRKTLLTMVERVASEVHIPFTVGGGINTVEDVRLLLAAGADKVSINSAAVANPQLIRELSEKFGSQCVVVAIDTNYDEDENWRVYTHGGKRATSLLTIDWASEVERLGAGEILLTSMSSDGTKKGFELELTRAVCNGVNIPIIASGGAGSAEHFVELFTKTEATGGLAASIFHFGILPVPNLKSTLKNYNIPIR